jgi:hypothetical protein
MGYNIRCSSCFFIASTPHPYSQLFNMADNPQKRLTVTFKDVAVQVAGLGEDYGSTVASVVTDLIPSFKKNRAQPRVRTRTRHEVKCEANMIAVHPPGHLRSNTPGRNGLLHSLQL